MTETVGRNKRSALRRRIEATLIERLASKWRNKAIAPYGPGKTSLLGIMFDVRQRHAAYGRYNYRDPQ
jgi:hypothetical protein